MTKEKKKIQDDFCLWINKIAIEKATMATTGTTFHDKISRKKKIIYKGTRGGNEYF